MDEYLAKTEPINDLLNSLKALSMEHEFYTAHDWTIPALRKMLCKQCDALEFLYNYAEEKEGISIYR